jgi:dTDP-4-dehydrorhamnose 3,5-epimerase
MPYTVYPTDLPEVLILQPKVFGDERGFFYESFNQRDFNAATGLDVTFVQDNHSRSARGVLRGLHYQIEHAQGKLVRVTAGEVYDVAVDLRRSSANFGRWTAVVLSAANQRQLWVPPGFGHGFVQGFGELGAAAPDVAGEAAPELELAVHVEGLAAEGGLEADAVLGEPDRGVGAVGDQHVGHFGIGAPFGEAADVVEVLFAGVGAEIDVVEIEVLDVGGDAQQVVDGVVDEAEGAAGEGGGD